MTERFAAKLTWWILPVFLMMGVTPGRCFVEVRPAALQIRLGWLFNRSFSRDSIAGAEPVSVPWYCGPGVHLDFRGRVFVTGAFGRGVEIRFAAPQSISWLFGGRCSRLVVTPKDADGFVAALAAAGGAAPASR